MAARLVVLVVLAFAVGGLAVVYRLRRRADGRRGSAGLPPLPADLVGQSDATWVVFTTPWCVSCDQVEQMLGDAFPRDHVVKVDATVRTELADLYDVRRAPTIVRADAVGSVTDRLVGVEGVRALLARQDSEIEQPRSPAIGTPPGT